MIFRAFSTLPSSFCSRTYFLLPNFDDVGAKTDFRQRISNVSLVYRYLQRAFSNIVELLEENSFSNLYNSIESVTRTLEMKLSEFHHKGVIIKFTEESIPEKGENEHVYLGTLELTVYDIQDEAAHQYGSVTYADTLLISEIILNMEKEHVSTNVFNLTKCIPPYCCWDPQLENDLRKRSPNVPMLPAVILHMGMNEIRVDFAACEIKPCMMRVMSRRFGVNWFSVKSITCYSTVSVSHLNKICPNKIQCSVMLIKLKKDSNEFWGIWQIEVVDIFAERKSRPLPAPFCVHHDDYAHLSSKLFSTEVPSCKGNCLLLVLRLGAAAYEALEHLQGCSVDVDIHERSEVACLTGSDLEERIKVAFKNGNRAHPVAEKTLLVSDENEFIADLMTKEARLVRDHLEACRWLSAAQDFHRGLTVDTLLARCGIPAEAKGCVEDKKSLLKRKLGIHLLPKSQREAEERQRNVELQVTIICGIHGSHMSNVVAFIANIGTTNTVWLVLHPKSLTDIPRQVTSCVKEKVERQKYPGENRQFRCLLVAPLWVSVPEVLAQMEPLLLSTPCSVSITSTITCVDPRMCLMGPNGFVLPGLGHYFDFGWVNIILLTNPSKSNVDDTIEDFKLKLLLEAIHEVNPRAIILKAPFGKPQNYTQLSLLLNDNLFGEAEMQRYRLLTYVNHCSFPAAYQLKAIQVQFKLALNKTRWNEALKGLQQNLSPFSDEPIVVHVEANLAFDADPKTVMCCRYWPQTGILKTRGGDMIQGSSPLSLSAHFLDTYQLYPRPEGWYYTGSYYVHMLGEKSFRHPCFDQIVDEHIAKENQKIKEYNARLMKNSDGELFD